MNNEIYITTPVPGGDLITVEYTELVLFMDIKAVVVVRLTFQQQQKVTQEKYNGRMDFPQVNQTTIYHELIVHITNSFQAELTNRQQYKLLQPATTS